MKRRCSAARHFDKLSASVPDWETQANFSLYFGILVLSCIEGQGLVPSETWWGTMIRSSFPTTYFTKTRGKIMTAQKILDPDATRTEKITLFQASELGKQLLRTNLSRNALQAVLEEKRKDKLNALVGFIEAGCSCNVETSSGPSVFGLFIPPSQQVELVRERNAWRRWGFTEEHFTKLGEPPAWPSGMLRTVVLDVGLDTIEQTLQEAGHCIAESTRKGRAYNYCRLPEMKFDRAHMRLHGDITHERGLRWRIIDLAASWGKKEGIRPEDVRNNRSPHSAVLWAASYFPRWIEAMDGTNVPYVWIPGYEQDFDEVNLWPGIPHLSCKGPDRVVVLEGGRRSDRRQDSAVPAFLL